MKKNDLLQVMSPTEVAEVCGDEGISVQAVYQWGDDVPSLRCYQIREYLAAKAPDKLRRLDELAGLHGTGARGSAPVQMAAAT